LRCLTPSTPIWAGRRVAAITLGLVLFRAKAVCTSQAFHRIWPNDSVADLHLLLVTTARHHFLVLLSREQKRFAVFNSMSSGSDKIVSQCTFESKRPQLPLSFDKAKDIRDAGYTEIIVRNLPKQRDQFACGHFCVLYASWIFHDKGPAEKLLTQVID